MERSKHWRIHYGPEAYEEEAYSVLDIINIRLNRLARKLDGSTIGCEAHVQTSGFEWYTWYHVMALIKFEQAMTEQELREHLLAVCGGRYTNTIRDDCELEMLYEREYERLRDDYSHYIQD